MLSETEVARDIYQVEEARPSRRARPPKELSLEQIIKNKTSSPCSLPEFMDYLVCDQENAEVLQFFTWFCGYVARFSGLSPHETVLSPPWKPELMDGRSGSRAGSTPTVHTHRRGGSDRLQRIMEIMDRRHARDAIYRVSDQGHRKINSNPLNFSTPRTFSGTHYSQLQLAPGQTRDSSSTTPADEAEAARRAQQPCRQEIDQVVRQYIRGDAPRRLKIPDEDLAECLDAVKHTTHPSSLLAAFTACETILKSRLHPAFIRKSQRNANKPRLILIRCLATLFILLGFGLSLVFILDTLPNFYRVISLVFWWPGFTLLLASFKGICLFLHLRNLRQLRPWEQCYDVENLTNQKTAATNTINDNNNYNDDDDDDDNDDEEPSAAEFKTYISSNNDRRRWGGDDYPARGTPSRTSSRASPYSTTSAATVDYSLAMQTFGGGNRRECEGKWEGWRRRSTARRIWDDRVRVESRTVRLLQDRTVLVAVCLAGALSSFLTVGSLWVPGLGH